MPINTNVWTNAANTESGKFVEIVNDARFPATSAVTDPSFGSPQIVEYPKYAVLVKNIDDTRSCSWLNGLGRDKPISQSFQYFINLRD